MSEQGKTVSEEPTKLGAMLSEAGYSARAVEYYLQQPSMGSLPHADHVSAVTGQCGDTMTVYLELDGKRIKDVRFQVLGCPGAVASAMAAADLMKGKTLQESAEITDRDILERLQGIPEKKLHCMRLAVKTVKRAVDECQRKADSPCATPEVDRASA